MSSSYSFAVSPMFLFSATFGHYEVASVVNSVQDHGALETAPHIYISHVEAVRTGVVIKHNVAPFVCGANPLAFGVGLQRTLGTVASSCNYCRTTHTVGFMPLCEPKF